MSVGKGSIKRAAVANDAAKEKQVAAKTITKSATKPVTKPATKPVTKSATKPALEKEKKEAPVRSSVIASTSIHEMKFDAVSHIYCELPTYLL